MADILCYTVLYARFRCDARECVNNGNEHLWSWVTIRCIQTAIILLELTALQYCTVQYRLNCVGVGGDGALAKRMRLPERMRR